MIIGTVESLWRYPVKGMAGSEVPEVFMGFAGIYGDRCYAIKNSAGRKGFPYLNANVQHQMLLYHPQFRHLERTLTPPNLIEAEKIDPGANPTVADAEDMELDVVTPSGEKISVEDPMLIKLFSEGLSADNQLKLVRSERALYDCRPVSLISMQTIGQIETELRIPLNKLRFRSNIYFNSEGGAFNEDNFVGRRLRIGSKAIVMVLERDPRCALISLDPNTAENNPEVLRHVVREHNNFAGVYCAVLVEGLLKKGDPIELLHD
jgi:MOSC domain-containing protein